MAHAVDLPLCSEPCKSRAVAAGASKAGKADLKESSYSVIWQARDPEQAFASEHTSWRLSAGQLSLRGPSKRKAGSERTTVYTALQSSLAFLHTAPVGGEISSLRQCPAVLGLLLKADTRIYLRQDKSRMLKPDG